jgi:hypothetical protein
MWELRSRNGRSRSRTGGKLCTRDGGKLIGRKEAGYLFLGRCNYVARKSARCGLPSRQLHCCGGLLRLRENHRGRNGRRNARSASNASGPRSKSFRRVDKQNQTSVDDQH